MTTTSTPSRLEIAIAGLDVSTKQKTESIPEPEKLLALDIFLYSHGDLTKRGENVWDRTFAQSITKALKQSAYTPVKIVGWIADITQPMTIAVPNGERTENVKGLRITITDSEGEILESLTAPVEGYQRDLYDLKRENQRLVFCGLIVPILRGSTPENRFFLWDVIPSWYAEDLINVDDSVEGDPIRNIIEEEATKPRGIFEYIKRTLVKQLSITGLDSLPGLSKCIDVMIYQAFSDGMNASPHYSNRIHSLVIGPPGQGKGFLTEIATILNPVSGQASTVGRKISAAGLVGTTVKRFERTISQPGLLPANSGGVLAFQDFHQLRKDKATVLAIISEVMQEGKAKDSTSARTIHEAVTAIHIDMNRISQVDRSAKVDAYSDLGIPHNVLSRLDFIIELSPKVNKSLDALEKRFKGANILSSDSQDKSEVARIRRLQRLVAYMRTYWRMVEIPEEVNHYILQRVKEAFGLGTGNRRFMDDDFKRDNINRVSQSVLKFVKAIACADRSLIATKADVDRAFEYVGEKIRFLENLSTGDVGSTPDPRTLRVKERLGDRLAQIKTRTFRTADYVGLFGPFQSEKDRKSARQATTRDLDRLVKDHKIERIGQGR